MKKVLVTGAGGFIGHHCLDILSGRGYEVHAVELAPPPRGDSSGVVWHEADLLQPEQIARLIGDVMPSHLLHLAWYAEPDTYWSSVRNLHWVGASLALIEQFASRGGRRAVVAGTCAEYDWSSPPPCREGVTPILPRGVYGACKHALQVAASAYAAEAGLSLAWGRVFFLYGPGEKPQRLVPSVIRSLLAGEQAVCRHGQFLRDYVHVQDAAGAFAAVVDGEVTGPVNIATGTDVSLGRVVSLIGRGLGREDLVAISEEPGSPQRVAADVTRLRDEAGFVPALDIEAGLEQTIQWWKQHNSPTP